MTKEGIYASRDRLGRTPIIVGKKEGAYCLSFESFAYLNLGYTDYKELGPAEIVFMTADEVAKEMNVSKAYAYKIIQRLNKEMESMGYITVSGRINRKFFMKKVNYDENLN